MGHDSIVGTAHDKFHLREDVPSPEIDWQIGEDIRGNVTIIAFRVLPLKHLSTLLGVGGLANTAQVSSNGC